MSSEIALLDSRRGEEWRYTDPAFLKALDLRPVRGTLGDKRQLVLSSLLGAEILKGAIIVENGEFKDTERVNIQGAELRVIQILSERTSDGVSSDSPLIHVRRSVVEVLHGEYAGSGLYINVSASAKVRIKFVHLTAHSDDSIRGEHSFGQSSYPRIVVQLEANAELVLEEYYVSPGSEVTLCSPFHEVKVGEGANFKYIKVVTGGPGSYHLSSLNLEQLADSTSALHVVALSGKLSRVELYPVLNGAGASNQIRSVSALGSVSQGDLYSLIDHSAEHTTSDEKVRGVYSERASGAFTGTILVRRAAQHTAAYQSSDALLLSRDARCDAQPQLKIYADEVKCSHGATVGQIDNEMLFYLRSRGIGEEDAKQILVQAFLGEALAELPDESRETISELVRKQLEAITQERKR